MFPRHTTVPKIITSENAKHRHSRLPQDLGHSCRTGNACSTGLGKIKSNKFNELNEKKQCTLENTRSNLPQATCGRSPSMYNVPYRPDQTWATPNTYGFSHKSWPLAHPEMAIRVRKILPRSATFSDQSAFEASHPIVPRVPPGLICAGGTGNFH